MGIYLPSTGTVGCEVWPGAQIAHSQGIPPDFYSQYMNVEPSIPLLPPSFHATYHLRASPPVSATPPLLLICMKEASLNLWLLDFLAVLGGICFEI